jgi:alkylation response protein AidB-like acyl-CoA dehydrogenase
MYVPALGIASGVMIGRTVVARGALKTVELVMEAAGGSAFYRAAGFERLFRDIQAARYHPLRNEAQRAFAGKLALGGEVDIV